MKSKRSDAGKYAKEDVFFVCIHCNTTNSLHRYKRLTSNMRGVTEYSYRIWTERKFCDDSCQRAYIRENGSPKKTAKRVPCDQCGTYLERIPARLNKYKNQFCNMRCKGLFMDNGITAENEKVRKSTPYKQWRTAVFERDDYTCQFCNERGGELHADHIKPFALFPELRLDIDNGRTLCADCHRTTDTYGVKALSVGRRV